MCEIFVTLTSRVRSSEKLDPSLESIKAKEFTFEFSQFLQVIPINAVKKKK